MGPARTRTLELGALSRAGMPSWSFEERGTQGAPTSPGADRLQDRRMLKVVLEFQVQDDVVCYLNITLSGVPSGV